MNLIVNNKIDEINFFIDYIFILIISINYSTPILKLSAAFYREEQCSMRKNARTDIYEGFREWYTAR